MFYDISALAIFEILALALGLIVGWLTYTSGAKGSWFSGWFRIALVLFVVGLILAWFRWPLNRAGFWLEAALLMFVAYIIGCFVGGALRQLFSAPKEEPKAVDRPAPRAPDAGVNASAAAPKAVAVAVVESATAKVTAVAPTVGEAASAATSAAKEVATQAASAPAVGEVLSAAPTVEASSGISSVGGATLAGLVGAAASTVAGAAGSVTEGASATAPAVDEAAGGVASQIAAMDSESAAPAPATQAPVASAPETAAAIVAAGEALGPEPETIAKVEGEEKHEGARPVGFVTPRGGVPDDLQRIKGIGPQNEGRLHALGIWHFYQIASWTRDNVHWVGSYLSFAGRIDREFWIEQATELAAGRATGAHKRAPRSDGSAGQDNVADLSQVKPRE